ncbi:MAG TPA: lipid-A-disaccharide synthase [Rhizomicrobium sp.]|jgi:lipid-A-disaccharide synthase|nr:lipid-A-disaccharide synthase [Rhizomicrobium sp.]
MSELTLMLVCGEPSGDRLGAELMAGLKALAGDEVRIVGVGGPAMAAQGLKSLFPLDDTAVMGLREVVPRIPAILRRVREASDYAMRVAPDAVVCIDSPDFTHRVAQRLRRIAPHIRTVNYAAPQVWASRSYRARRMARYFDLVLALLPFEAPFFEVHGLHAVFVGNPVIERAVQMKGGNALRDRLGIAGDATVLAVLPGSRMNEVRLLLPPFREAVALLRREIADLVCLLPTVDHVGGYVREHTGNWPAPLHVVQTDADKYAAFDAATAAIAASGTVTTELALAGTPMVVAYRLGALTYALARPFVRVRYITLANILLDRAAVPEFMQRACTGTALAQAALPLSRDQAARDRHKRDLAAAMAKLGLGSAPPSLRAARALLAFARKQYYRRSIGT